MKKLILFAVAAVVVLSSAAASATYRQDFRTYTKEGRLYSIEDFDAKVIWNCTFFSDTFRKAFEKRHIEINYLDDADAEQFVAEQELRQQQGWDFFIGFYTKRDYGDLGQTPDSFWKVRLFTESGEVLEPLLVEKVPVTPYGKKMFRYLHRWSKAFRVTFPKVDIGKKFELQMYSVVGESRAKWHLKR